MKVTAQRKYTDATIVNVGTFRKPELIPAARITVERGAAARHRINASIRAGKYLRAQAAA